MTLWVDVARVPIGANLLLLAALVVVWSRNYRECRSKQTFDGVSAIPSGAQIAMTALRVAEFGGLAFLTWATWD